MNKIETAIEILMAEKNLFWCKECEDWVYNEDDNYDLDFCYECFKKI